MNEISITKARFDEIINMIYKREFSPQDDDFARGWRAATATIAKEMLRAFIEDGEQRLAALRAQNRYESCLDEINTMFDSN